MSCLWLWLYSSLTCIYLLLCVLLYRVVMASSFGVVYIMYISRYLFLYHLGLYTCSRLFTLAFFSKWIFLQVLFCEAQNLQFTRYFCPSAANILAVLCPSKAFKASTLIGSPWLVSSLDVINFLHSTPCHGAFHSALTIAFMRSMRSVRNFLSPITRWEARLLWLSFFRQGTSLKHPYHTSC